MMKCHLPTYALLGIIGLGDGDGSDRNDAMDSSAVLARDRNLFNACHMVPGDAVRGHSANALLATATFNMHGSNPIHDTHFSCNSQEWRVPNRENDSCEMSLPNSS